MPDSRSSGHLGRRLSSRGFSPASGERSDRSTSQSPSRVSGGPLSPLGALRESSSAFEGADEGISVVSTIAQRGVRTPQHCESPSGGGGACGGGAGASSSAAAAPSVAKRIAFACVALSSYVLLSILTVFWTKHLVGGKVPIPLFLSWVQQAVGLVLYSGVSAAVAAVCNDRWAVSRALRAAFPVVQLRGKIALNVFPLSICFVGMIGSANLCLQRVQVSVYQVARS